MVKRFISYLRVDLYRCFVNWRFWAAVLVIFAVLLGSLRERIANVGGKDVYGNFLNTVGLAPALLIFSGSMIAFTGSLCEDREHKYIQNMILRGSIKSYLAARLVVLFIAAQMSVTIGGSLFALLLRCFYPWAAPGTTNDYEIALHSSIFSGLVENEHHFLFFVLWNLIQGIFAGILAVISAWISLYIPSRVMILAAPVVLYYFLDVLVGTLFPGGQIMLFFSIDYGWTTDRTKALLAITGITLGSVVLFGCLIYKKLTGESGIYE